MWVPPVYFRKWVAIRNRRLWILKLISDLVVYVLVAFALVKIPIYEQDVHPHIRLNLWPTLPESIGQACTNESTAQYDYWPEGHSPWRFDNAKCAEVTADVCSSSATACVHRSNIVKGSDTELLFATAFVEDVFNASSGQFTTASYLLPAAESLSATFMLSYTMDLPKSYFHSVFGIALLPRTEVKVVLVGASGATHEIAAAGRPLATVTVAQILQLANLDLDVPAKNERSLQEFPACQKHGRNNRPRARITGADIHFYAELSNSIIDAAWDGPVLKVYVQGYQTWAGSTQVDFLDEEGSTRTRTFQGMRFVFRIEGTFSWFQINRVIYTLSLGWAWLQMPCVVVFYFVVFCLGTLSDIYNGFLYEDVDLQKEFNGVSSRMLGMTYGFHDLHDLEEADNMMWGVSQERLSRRMDMILEGCPELDLSERTQFTNFYFERCSSEMPSRLMAVQLEDHRSHHMSNENLIFDDVIQIVDSDAYVGNLLERLFMDDSLKNFSATAENQEAKLLGRPRRKSSIRLTFKPKNELLDMLMRERHVMVLATPCSLERAHLGQTITQQQMENLQQALEKMHQTCEYVQWRADESDDDETDEQDEEGESSEGAAEPEGRLMELPGVNEDNVGGDGSGTRQPALSWAPDSVLVASIPVAV